MSPIASPIPLLLVADSAETCERIASALLSAPAFYRIERVTSTELMQNGPPGDIRLALVDQSLRACKQAQVVQKLNGAGLAVVAMVDSHDVQALQEVVLAGAAALLATPFVDTQLWETVSAAITRGARQARPEVAQRGANGTRRPVRAAEGIVVAIYGPKGGTGTSVLAVNLAVALQEKAPRGVVLMEVSEGMGSLAVLLNLRAERTMGDLLARFDPGDTELLHGVLMPHTSGIKVLLASPTPGIKVGGDFLEDVIGSLQAMFDFVVIDLCSAARASALTVMRKAHAALVMVVPEMTALHHGRLFIEQVENTMPEVQLNVVLNRSNMPGGVPPEAIRRHLKMQTAAEIPDEPQLISSSVNRGVPLVTSQPRSGVTKAIQKLAKDLAPAEVDRAPERINLAPAPGPLGRLAIGGRRG
jgi:pilus assembly protein CpaE